MHRYAWVLWEAMALLMKKAQMEGRGWLSSVIGTKSRTVSQSQKRNSKNVFDTISELRPKCSSTKIEKKNEEKMKKMKRKQAAIQNPLTTSLYIMKIYNSRNALESCRNI
jgi:hypothetical protein